MELHTSLYSCTITQSHLSPVDQHCRYMDLDGMDVKFHSNHPAGTAARQLLCTIWHILDHCSDGEGAYTACQDSSSKASPINGIMPGGACQNQREPRRQKRQRRAQLTPGMWDSAKHSAKGCAVRSSTHRMELDVRRQLFS